MTVRTSDTLAKISFALLGVLLTLAFVRYAHAASAGAGPDQGEPSVVEHAATGGWWAMRKGIVGIAMLFVIHFGGAALHRRRGYVVKRWPRLDVGQAWAALSVIVSTTATLVPLAVTGDLTMAVVLAQLGAAVGLLTHSTLQPPTTTAAAETP